MRSVEIFSGAGGLAKGLDLAGFEHAAFVEWNKDACASLRQNFSPDIVYCGDIQEYDFTKLSQVDVVAGGPPCQPFSLGGKHQADLDQRDMFPYAIKSIETLQPKLFIFENVKGLLRESFGDYFAYILLRLANPCQPAGADVDWRIHLNQLKSKRGGIASGIKYEVSHQLLNAADYGVPQCRPQYVASIFAETKRVELRRVKPRLKAGDLVIIYESEGTKGIVGAFTVKGVTTARPENIWRKHKDESGVTKQQFDAYFEGVGVGYAIQIGAVWRLPAPILLSTLRERREGFRPPQSYHYLSKPDMMSLGEGDLSFMPFNATEARQDSNSVFAR